MFKETIGVIIEEYTFKAIPEGLRMIGFSTPVLRVQG